jgi:hypothetical protein
MFVRHAPRRTANACAHIQDMLPGLQRRHLRQRVRCCQSSHMKHVQPVEVIGSRLLDGDSSRPQCLRKLPRQVDSSKPEFRRRAIARDSAPVAGFPARRAA